ncbi:galactose-1-epimerase [Providencia rettgeri]
MRLTQEQCQTFRAPKVIALTNKNGMKVILSSLGASWVSCILPVAAGKRDVILGSPNMAKQMEQGVYLGSIVGRVANHINNSQFMLNEQKYQVTNNQGIHYQRGGKYNFSHRIWGIFQPTPQKAIFSLASSAGEQGFPSQLDVEVSYELTEDNQVVIHHNYQVTEACPVNLANHIYFNLAGEDSVRTALEHDLYIDADQYLPTDMDGISTGEWHNVAETNFDFRQSKRIGRDFLQDDVQRRVGGYDHTFILNNALTDGEQTVATLSAPSGDVCLNIATTQPALHVYSGNNLLATSGKTRTYVPYSGVVMATQFPTDAINHSERGTRYSSIALSQQVYRSQTRYQFIF